MKKISTLLLLFFAALTFKTVAQTPTACNAEFSIQFTNAYTVQFTPVMPGEPGAVQHYWFFDDGNSSTLVAPSHVYNNTGTYTVRHYLIRNNPNGVEVCRDSVFKTITIQQAPCNLQANFNWTVSAQDPLQVAFTNTTINLAATDSVRWTFGDGTSSLDVNPSHHYTTGGTYTVCLRVKRMINSTTTPCVSEICKTITVQNPCNLQANFTWNASTANPLMIEFHNQSTPLSSTDSIYWSFGDGSSSTAVSPNHTYNQPGTYNVCLVVRKTITPGSAPCVREICKTITVQAPPCNLVVDFSWNAAASNPLLIEFHNLSTPLSSTDSIKWSFGDGTYSTAVSPNHVYSQPGTYTVCLVVRKANTAGTAPCVREICKTITVQAPPCNLQVNFTWNPSTANPLMIEFHNQSTPLDPTDSIYWSFGDGSYSTAVNPNHTYNQPGTYNVCLIVKKSNTCVREMCKTITVQAPPCNLQVYFTWNASTANPLMIEFHNQTTPLNPTDSVYWTFGDGSSSTAVNPNHTYNQPGTYHVCLIVRRATATGTTPCVREYCKDVVVQAPPCNIQVAFSWQTDPQNFRKVIFTNLTVTPTPNAVATWTFGDGTSATSWNAVHEYAQPGRYLVCLKVQYSNTCIRTYCDSVTIAAPMPPCNQLSNFGFEKFANDNQKYKFTPAYINTTLQYTWTFGDGTGSHDIIATHRYAQPGTYTVCLTVWNGPNCASTTCKTITVQQQIYCDSVHVSYTYQRTTAYPNKLYFFANSNMPILDQVWTITRIPATSTSGTVTLHQNNPTYIFPDTGSYRVCLKAITAGGCVKEYCSIIRIELVQSNICELQAFPNPTTSAVNVNVFLTAPEMIHAYIYNSANVLVKEKHQQGVTGGNLVTIPVQDLVAGLYNMKIIYGNRICYARFQKL